MANFPQLWEAAYILKEGSAEQITPSAARKHSLCEGCGFNIQSAVHLTDKESLHPCSSDMFAMKWIL